MGLNFSFFSKFSFLIHCYGQKEHRNTESEKTQQTILYDQYTSSVRPTAPQLQPNALLLLGGTNPGLEEGEH